jgi:preprotein translocase subunit SecA
MGPIFHGLGLSVGSSSTTGVRLRPRAPGTDERLLNLRPVSRREAYAADVTYGTNNEFGFDYLRDNMVQELTSASSASATSRSSTRSTTSSSTRRARRSSSAARPRSRRTSTTSSPGSCPASAAARWRRGGRRLLRRPQGARPSRRPRRASTRWSAARRREHVRRRPAAARHFEQALKAHALYKRDRDYIVKDGEIVIVDEFTGRQMPGRRWSEGLHQAIEAKEGLRVQRESATLATITFQNYFRLYDKLAGMTGTAMTEAGGVLQDLRPRGGRHPDPPADDPRRRRRPRLRQENDKFNARHRRDRRDDRGGPAGPRRHGERREVSRSSARCSSGAASSTRCSTPSSTRRRRRSSPRPAAAGAVTIATNMAGRGTDILLGGNPAGMASEPSSTSGHQPGRGADRGVRGGARRGRGESARGPQAKVVAAGGLHIIGTERHEARRIDNQLRGRAGRQGDPGSSRFYLSLEDDAHEALRLGPGRRAHGALGSTDDTAIESRLVSKTIENAQTRVEGYNFDIRKRVVEYDDVINRSARRSTPSATRCCATRT